MSVVLRAIRRVGEKIGEKLITRAARSITRTIEEFVTHAESRGLIRELKPVMEKIASKATEIGFSKAEVSDVKKFATAIIKRFEAAHLGNRQAFETLRKLAFEAGPEHAPKIQKLLIEYSRYTRNRALKRLAKVAIPTGTALTLAYTYNYMLPQEDRFAKAMQESLKHRLMHEIRQIFDLDVKTAEDIAEDLAENIVQNFWFKYHRYLGGAFPGAEIPGMVELGLLSAKVTHDLRNIMWRTKQLVAKALSSNYDEIVRKVLEQVMNETSKVKGGNVRQMLRYLKENNMFDMYLLNALYNSETGREVEKLVKQLFAAYKIPADKQTIEDMTKTLLELALMGELKKNPRLLDYLYLRAQSLASEVASGRAVATVRAI